MILGMSLSAFTTLHVVISLIGIVAGIIVMFGMLGSNPMPGLTAIFLLFTILTSVTGFLFPFKGVTPGDVVGALSLVLLAIACIALYIMKLSGGWRWIYVLTALISLYLNVFVLVIQSFLQIPALTVLAPANPPSGPAKSCAMIFWIIRTSNQSSSVTTRASSVSACRRLAWTRNATGA